MNIQILVASTLSAFLAACSNQVKITADTTGGGGNTTLASGVGAAFVGGTGGSAVGTSTSAPSKVVTADTDIAQYAAITTSNMSPEPGSTKVLEGPFFITDVLGGAYPLTTVPGSDCTLPFDKHTIVVAVLTSQTYQLHGMRVPILQGQSLCIQAGLNYNVTVLGFRPY